MMISVIFPFSFMSITCKMLLLLLLNIVSADMFVAFSDAIPGLIDIFDVQKDSCILNTTLYKKCYDHSYDFDINNLHVVHETDRYVLNIDDDNLTYTIYNPQYTLPNIKEDYHFANSVYTVNNTNVMHLSMLNNGYDVLNSYDDVMYTIVKQFQTLCVPTNNVTYTLFYYINVYSEKAIRKEVPLVHVVSYFQQFYYGDCDKRSSTLSDIQIFIIACFVFVLLLLAVYGLKKCCKEQYSY